jgi:hypothetical protein
LGGHVWGLGFRLVDVLFCFIQSFILRTRYHGVSLKVKNVILEGVLNTHARYARIVFVYSQHVFHLRHSKRRTLGSSEVLTFRDSIVPTSFHQHPHLTK